ncbi:MAG TPA: hypothetical protein VFQ61_18565, partial [Polyangiaceae bacterium]|nr:hypothetical protein [Polyangiaceae bacterium]
MNSALWAWLGGIFAIVGCRPDASTSPIPGTVQAGGATALPSFGGSAGATNMQSGGITSGGATGATSSGGSGLVAGTGSMPASGGTASTGGASGGVNTGGQGTGNAAGMGGATTAGMNAGGATNTAGSSAGNTGGASGGAAGAASGGGSSKAVPSAGCGKSGRPNGGVVTVNNDHIYTFPTSYDGTKPLPLLIGFHAAGNPIDQIQKLTNGSSFESNYVRAFPKSAGNEWVYNTDLNKAYKVYDDLLANYCVDTSRVFATGHSSGAQMIVQILVHKDAADHFKFKAVAPVA